MVFGTGGGVIFLTVSVVISAYQYSAVQSNAIKIVKTVLNHSKILSNSWGSYTATGSKITEKGELLCSICNAVIY